MRFPCRVLLFKRILDFQKREGGMLDKRGAKRYPVGLKYPLKAKITLMAHDGEGRAVAAAKKAPMDWGGQLVNLSTSGANIRLHPAAVAAPGEPCMIKLELDNVLYEVDAEVANYRINAQYVNCGIGLKFPDNYSRKAYQQLMEPIVIGSTFTESTAKVKQDLPGLIKEEYHGESESVLGIWRDSAKAPKLFELLVHDYYVRGNTEMPGLKVGYRDGATAGKSVSRPAFPVAMSADHQREVTRLYQYIVQNLGKGIPADGRKFLEMFAT